LNHRVVNCKSGVMGPPILDHTKRMNRYTSMMRGSAGGSQGVSV
jgi:hypothetical protein